MARLVLALMIIAIAAVMVAVAAKSVARLIEVTRGDGTADIGNSMQKIAFFVLICLMAYVSMSGGS